MRRRGHSYVSQEFGGLKKGDSRRFNSNNVLYQGNSTGLVAAHISVWEADQSSEEWWSALKGALNTAVKLIDGQLSALGLIDDLFGGFGVPLWVTIGFEVAKVFVATIDIWRNYDDLSCSRLIGLERQDLAVLSHRGHATWNFNGDGHHTLKVVWGHTSVVPFPVRTLECAQLTGDTWGAPVSLGWKSITPPALASYNGKLYAAFVRPEDHKVMWTRREGHQWRKPEPVGSDNSIFAPALVAAHGKLFYAVTGGGDSLWWRTFTESGSWTPPQKFEGYNPGIAPTMAAFSNRVWLTHVGTDEKVYLNTHDGKQWSGAYQNNRNWITENPVAMAATGDHVWRIARGLDGKVYTTTSGGTSNWDEHPVHPTWKVSKGVGLASHNGKLWIFLRDMDGYLRAATRTAAGPWSAAHYVSGTKKIPLQGEPSAASHDGKLYVMYTR